MKEDRLSLSDTQGEVERYRLRCQELEEANSQLNSRLRDSEVSTQSLSLTNLFIFVFFIECHSR